MIMPNACLSSDRCRHSRRSQRSRRRSVKPSASPTLVRTQHLPLPAEIARGLGIPGLVGLLAVVPLCVMMCRCEPLHSSGYGRMADGTGPEQAVHRTACSADFKGSAGLGEGARQVSRRSLVVAGLARVWPTESGDNRSAAPHVRSSVAGPRRAALGVNRVTAPASRPRRPGPHAPAECGEPCECRKRHPCLATRRYSLIVPPTRVCLRTRYCSRSTGLGRGFSGAAASSDRWGRWRLWWVWYWRRTRCRWL